MADREDSIDLEEQTNAAWPLVAQESVVSPLSVADDEQQLLAEKLRAKANDVVQDHTEDSEVSHVHHDNNNNNSSSNNNNNNNIRTRKSRKLEVTPTNQSSTSQESSVISSQVSAVMPGAVSVRGSNNKYYAQSSGSSSFDDCNSETQSQDDSSIVLPAELVQTPEVDSVTTSRIAEDVLNAVLQDTVEAEILSKEDLKAKETAKSSHYGWKRGLFWTLVLVCIGVAIFLVVYFVEKDDSSSDKATPLSSAVQNGTLAPNSSTPTTQTSCYCVQNVTLDFSNNVTQNISEQLAAASNHTTLLFLFNATGQIYSLNNATLFAPTDEVFDLLPTPYFYYASNHLYWIIHFLKLTMCHFVAEPLTASQIFRLDEIPTAGGYNLTVNRTDTTIVNEAKILRSDVRASDGYIQVTDRVLIFEEFRRTMLDVTKTFTLGSEFSTFGKIIAFAGVDDILSLYLSNGLTLLTPTNSAFEERGTQFVEELTTPGNENKTRNFALYHMLRSNVYEDILIQLYNFNHVGEFVWLSYENHLSLWFTVNPNAAFVNNVHIQQMDDALFANNGVITVIDQVLIPPNIDDLMQTTTNVTNHTSFATFLSIVHGPANMSSFFTNDGSLTLFAPLDVAFQPSPNPFKRWLQTGWLLHLQSLVRFHCVDQTIIIADLVAGNYTFTTLSGFISTTLQVLSNATSPFDEASYNRLAFDKPPARINATFDNGSVVKRNSLFAVNGILYGIDGVLLPPWVESDINTTLARRDDFSTLIELAAKANLTHFLVGSGPFTILAPNNTAFANALSVASSTNVTMIREIVLRHILVGNVYRSDFRNSVVSQSLETLLVQNSNSQTSIGGAIVLESDILSNNGVVHVIDRVLLGTSN